MLGTMSRDQILQIVRRWDALRLGRAQEVLLDRICIVAERHLNRALEAVNVAIIAGPLNWKVGTLLLQSERGWYVLLGMSRASSSAG